MMSRMDRNVIYAGRSASITVRSGDDLRTPVFDFGIAMALQTLSFLMRHVPVLLPDVRRRCISLLSGRVRHLQSLVKWRRSAHTE
jgi:hypothetical protein